MLRNITTILVGVNLVLACGNGPSKISNTKKNQKENSIVKVTKPVVDSSWVEITEDEYGVILDLAYATPNNFTKEKIYNCPRCFLRKEAAAALKRASEDFAQSGFKLKILDAYRPVQYQQRMYDIVKNPKYVALPTKGSMHNKGLALDVTLVESRGIEFDMGSDFDDFTERAHYSYKGLVGLQPFNRRILRDRMKKAGFSPYDNEWWHFSYKKVDYPLDSFLWSCD